MKRRVFIVAALAAAVAGRSAGEAPSASADSAKKASGPGIVNGGFETWLPANERTGAPRPAGWSGICQALPGVKPDGKIERDARIRHSGRFSLRIRNANNGSLSYARTARPAPIESNRRYLLRWWVRGENVGPGGAGPIMMGYYLARRGGRQLRINFIQPGEDRPRGTFDWQRKQFVFVTCPGATTATFTFQLRYTTGTVWIDDIELIPCEAVTPVDTY